MKRLIVNMKSYLMSDAIKMAFLDNADLSVYIVEDEYDVVNKCFLLQADIALMEVGEMSPFDLKGRLFLKDKIKEKCPLCKIVLIVNENEDQKLVSDVKQAKTDGLIDQFIFGSISAKYLIALLETI